MTVEQHRPGKAISRAARALPSISLVIPTFREAANLPHVISAVDRVRSQQHLNLELWIVDDESRDGTLEIVHRLALPWVNLVVRTTNRDLSQAVLEGMRRSRNEVIVVMDADMSHPVQTIPHLVRAVAEGADFAIGSRYVAGGRTDPGWGFFRKANSRVATLVARPLTSVHDPMSGFFAIRRDRFETAVGLNPIGYKIGLELIVRCGCKQIQEIPICFNERQFGKSKLRLREQLRYVQHVRRLMLFKHPSLSSFLQFAVVGASGALVNLMVLKVLSLAGLRDRISIAAAIGVSLVSNFLLNRRFTFSYVLGGSIIRQFLGFAGASAVGMIVNYFVALRVRSRLGFPLLLAACCGIAAGMAFNFVINRYLVFRRPAKPPK